MRAALATLATLFVAHGAAAEPSRWDLARDPSLARSRDALARGAEARVMRDLVPEARSLAEQLLALQAATVVELAGGEGLSDPAVGYFLGDALVVADHGDDERGRRILLRALDAAPDSPSAARAFADVGVASSRLGDHEIARHAFDEALSLEWEPRARESLRLARGAVAMALGDLRAAREDFESVVDTATSSEAHALARWSLAAALSREGDLAAALRQADEAAQIAFQDSQGNAVTVLELPTVRLVPSYDGLYYRALAAMAAAERATETSVAKVELDWAISLFKRYAAAARTAGDRYLAAAELGQRSAEGRLDALARPGESRRLPRRGRPGAR